MDKVLMRLHWGTLLVPLHPRLIRLEQAYKVKTASCVKDNVNLQTLDFQTNDSSNVHWLMKVKVNLLFLEFHVRRKLQDCYNQDLLSGNNLIECKY